MNDYLNTVGAGTTIAFIVGSAALAFRHPSEVFRLAKFTWIVVLLLCGTFLLAQVGGMSSGLSSILSLPVQEDPKDAAWRARMEEILNKLDDGVAKSSRTESGATSQRANPPSIDPTNPVVIVHAYEIGFLRDHLRNSGYAVEIAAIATLWFVFLAFLPREFPSKHPQLPVECPAPHTSDPSEDS